MSSSELDDQWEEASTNAKPPKRTRRDSLKGVLRGEAKRIIPLIGGLIVILITTWQLKLQTRMGSVEDKAETAEAVGEKGERKAKEVKKEAQAGYEKTAEKVDDSGATIEKLAAEVNALRDEVERLKAAKAGRRPRRKPAITVPETVTQPLPPTPAAAAAQEKP